ncbi:MAG TPA: hypothetical protein VIY54_10285 [Steroidobacteraceae bacterium]
MHPPARAFFSFPCPFADCDGQFDLTAPVKAALATGAEVADGALECSGSRARMRSSPQPCGLHLHFTITPEYRPNARA